MVCYNLSQGVILGLDVLISTCAVINMHDQSVMFRSPDPSVSPEYAYFVSIQTPETYLALSDDVTVLPREQKLVVVECSSMQSSPIAMAVQNVKSTAQFHIGVSNSILDTSYSCIRIMVSNRMAIPSALPKCLRLATIHSCNTANVASVGTISVSRKAKIDCYNHRRFIFFRFTDSGRLQISIDDQVPQDLPELDFSPKIDSRLSTQERDSSEQLFAPTQKSLPWTRLP